MVLNPSEQQLNVDEYTSFSEMWKKSFSKQIFEKQNFLAIVEKFNLIMVKIWTVQNIARNVFRKADNFPPEQKSVKICTKLNFYAKWSHCQVANVNRPFTVFSY